MVRRTICFLAIAFVGMGQGFAQTNAQTAAQTSAQPPIMPKKPKALMLMAAQLNGLSGIQHPWHIKADFQTFDADGKPAGQGVFEEWWAGPTKYKISYTSGHFNQVEYRNGASDVASGDSVWPLVSLLELRGSLVQPLPAISKIEEEKYFQENASVGGQEMRCVEQTRHVHSPTFSDPLLAVKACFGLKIPAARVVFTGSGIYAIFDKIARADGHYIPEQIAVYDGNLPILTANVVSLDFPNKIDDAEFIPAGSTSPASLPTLPGHGVAIGKTYRLYGHYPRYPLSAKQKHIYGAVILQAWISKSGDITNLRILSGPPALQQSTYDAIKKWIYMPFLYNGQPVRVQITIKIVYEPGEN